MEFIKNTAARFGSLLLIVCLAFLGTMAFSSCDNKDEEDEDGYRTFKSAFDLKFTRVERVGSVLIADFTLKNKSGKAIRNFRLSREGAADNLKDYMWYNMDLRFDLGEYSSDCTVTLDKDETITGTFRIREFDTTNSAKTAKFLFTCTADEANLNSHTVVSTADLKITDNRVLINGIQTNDLGLDYVLEKTYQDGTDVYLTFSLTNKTGNILNNLRLNRVSASANGTKYDFWNIGIALGNGTDYTSDVTVDLRRDATETYTIKVNSVKRQVSQMSVDLDISSSYVFADDMVRLISVPVPYTRR